MQKYRRRLALSDEYDVSRRCLTRNLWFEKFSVVGKLQDYCVKWCDLGIGLRRVWQVTFCVKFIFGMSLIFSLSVDWKLGRNC